ncbi:MAG TPA: putative 2-aminoethylphosphonate ABC transporter ATP-binding protein [Burkholderiaceae bacterium]|jgi:iron(III) transport system ATP-binding protein|nr:putative 2-aminoethylphosphonate ABC transporter ATP-binding protein [Burkholderiaceae bacterium]
MDMSVPAALAARLSESDSAATALTIRGIHKRFDRFVALQQIDLTVRQGEMLCLLGPSGCGKTTLLRIIAGLETQSGGTIVQNGRDISQLPPVKRDYGIVFQSYALFPNLTIAENVAYGLVNRRKPRAEVKARVEELLTMVGLPTSGDKYPGQLSGGQQQRIALARALATSPRLLLLDEPLSALDALERIRLRGEIRRLQQQLGVTTIMVTHDQEEALSMADRIVVMNHGVIEQIGTPHEVYERPATPFVADFVGKVNVLPAVALGGGRYRASRLELQCAGDCGDYAPGTSVRLYLRPEDRAVDGALDGAPNRVHGLVTKVEFLGGSCLAEMSIDELEGLPLHLYFSLNQLHDLGVRVGAQLEVALRSDRIRVFGAKGAAQ